jgi:hypothetical protein
MLPNLAALLLTWLRTQFGSLQQPAPWLVGSLLLAVVATNLAWLAEQMLDRRGRRLAGRQGPGGRSGGRRLADAPVLAPLFWLVGALFMLLPPLGAWQRGAISPYLLGLTEIDWVAELRSGALPAAAIVGISVLGWLVYRHTLRGRDGRFSGTPLGGPLGMAQRWTAPLDAALRQWHWAFYRAAAVAWLLAGVAGPGSASTAAAAAAAVAAPALRLPGGIVLSPPSLDSAAALYWGAWLGLAAVALEWLLNPFVRRALRTPGRQEAALRDAGLAIATTALFALTRNFWLCLACQVLAETAMALLSGEEQPTTAG